MSKVLMIVGFSIFFIIIDLYIYQAIKVSIQGLSWPWRKGIIVGFWTLTAFSIISVLLINTMAADFFSRDVKRFIVTGIVMLYFSKVFGVLTLLIDDVFRAGQWVVSKFVTHNSPENPSGDGITRSAFLSKASLIAVAAPLTTFGIGIASGAHNYRVRRKTIHLPNLPSSFDGIQIGQLSDIHSGSFFSRSGVKRGIDLLLGEKPDVVFFTGDLVNDEAGEVAKYKDIFSKVKAPLGVYSTLGNHDYGDYRSWNNINEKKKNLADLIQTHKEMGWDILLNENRTLKINGDEIAIIGIENWGAGRFQKYGDLEKAYQGTEEKPVKLLLSHDPSHWDAQVRPQYNDIDVMFAGHTHGFQFGVEIGDFKWSPSQYIYKQWADLHQEGNQYLYVNRGFGFIGYPGRIGILPEITIIELKKA
ncbi:MAG: metallophosphoesterase [Cyclobacteriaceae bacterium]|nr:metallophosphoesterase [Cyclobacteriaceae bacterium]